MRMLVSSLLLLGCIWVAVVGQADETNGTSAMNETDEITVGLVHHTLAGNHFIGGNAAIAQTEGQVIALSDEPRWIVGHATGDTVTWFVQTATSELLRVNRSVDGPQVESLGSWPTLPVLRNGEPLRPLDAVANPLSPPVPLLGGRLLQVTDSGVLVLLDTEGEISRVELNAPADARPVVSADGRIALYTQGTNQRYVHAIMGDDIEGASLMVLRVEGDALVPFEELPLFGDAVYEGLYPFWADVNEDGVEDLVTTVSDGRVGSRLRAYLLTEGATLTVDGPAIGRPGRWQHQLAWGPFGVNGENQLVEVLTPHIGGVVRLYRFSGTSLEIVASQPGYTSHVIGSRNLDMAVGGDFDNDGRPEIVMPSQSRTTLAGIQRTATGTRIAWEVSLDGSLSTNVAATTTANGENALAVGTQDGRLLIWQP